jgi:hypothetical protein
MRTVAGFFVFLGTSTARAEALLPDGVRLRLPIRNTTIESNHVLS